MATTDLTLPEPEENPAIETASNEYLGRWNRLVSTTNSKKDRIVAESREALVEASAPPSACSDAAWSRRVGSVTPQHTGRLRRPYQRFAAMREAYRGLCRAASRPPWIGTTPKCGWKGPSEPLVDRRDAGPAFANAGGPSGRSIDATAVEVDEDAVVAPVDLPPAGSATMIEAREADEADADDADLSNANDDSVPLDMPASHVADEPLRPFENLPSLPADLRDAFDGFKLAIIHHRISQWQEVSREDVLATLEALRQLTLRPPMKARARVSRRASWSVGPSP